MESLYWCTFLGAIFVLAALPPGTDAMCTVPEDLAGNVFLRPTDTTGLTFTTTTVNPDIQYNGVALPTFSCDTVSGNDYIFISSATYMEYMGESLFYFCWRLVRVTPSSYMLYELSPVTSAAYNSVRGYHQLYNDTTPVTASQICTENAKSTFWTTLVKEGANATDVATPCPSILQADFTYDRCNGSSAIAFCPGGYKGTAEYDLCSTQIFQSTDGVVYCMGSVTRDNSTYVNLYVPEKGKKTVCFRIQRNGSTIEGSYYTGDCTTNIDSDMVLTYTAKCTPDAEDSVETVGLIAGIILGILALIALVGFLLFWFVIKKRKYS